MLRYVGAVELGIKRVRLADLDRLTRRRPVVPCSIRARWMEPQMLCVVRFAGWRPSGVWRNPGIVAWEGAPAGATSVSG